MNPHNSNPYLFEPKHKYLRASSHNCRKTWVHFKRCGILSKLGSYSCCKVTWAVNVLIIFTPSCNVMINEVVQKWGHK